MSTQTRAHFTPRARQGTSQRISLDVRAAVPARGMSLIEVLVALVVVSIGLLGIAKMQALAIASTRGSSTRSLISIEAASLASAMHANQLYWQQVSNTTTTFTAAVANNAITSSSDANLVGQTTNCSTTVCVGRPMAAYDLVTWGSNLNSVINGSTGTVDCSGAPVTCTITISWTENMVGLNASTQYATGTGTNPQTTQAQQQTQQLQYALLVQP
jgi:type IV pilus assembly protein PilV